MIAACLPDILARVLTTNSSPLPKTFQVTINIRGTVTVNSRDPLTPISAYLPFFPPFLSAINQFFPTGESPWLPSSLPPTNLQIIIHPLPFRFLASNHEKLGNTLQPSIRHSVGADIVSARFLNHDSESRHDKFATSVVVAACAEDIALFGTLILLFSRTRRVEKASSANRFTQCLKCWQYGHMAARCQSTLPVCPLCSLNHSRRTIGARTRPARRVTTSNPFPPAVAPPPCNIPIVTSHVPLRIPPAQPVHPVSRKETIWTQTIDVTGLFLSNENTIGPAVVLLSLVLREASEGHSGQEIIVEGQVGTKRIAIQPSVFFE